MQERGARHWQDSEISAEPARVLHCMWTGGIGGTERAVYQLVREQLRDPLLAPAVLFARAEGHYADKVLELGCPVIALDLPSGRSLGRLGDIAAAMEPFDIHHFHSAEPLLMLASGRCQGARRVYTHRGGTTRYSPKKRVQYAIVGILLRRSFQGFSGNTAHAARCASELFKLPLERVIVTYNGIEFDLLQPSRPADEVRAELGLGAQDFVLGSAANLKRWKRIDRLIEAIRAIGDSSLRLLVVGDGEDRERLGRLTADSGVSRQVVFAGLREDVADLLQVMDAFCLPSTGLESFGNAAVEAMATALPTIVFADGGGLVEHIDPGETGFIAADQGELETTIQLLAADRELATRVGAAGSAAVRSRYTPERATAAYRDLYAAAGVPGASLPESG